MRYVFRNAFILTGTLYAPEYDSGLLWNDETINIDWKFEEFGINPDELTISEKDKVQQKFDLNKDYFE